MSTKYKLPILARESGGNRDTYKAVGQLDYSFDVKFDKNGKGSVKNMHEKFTDLSEKKK
jgi:hypothetical protein